MARTPLLDLSPFQTPNPFRTTPDEGSPLEEQEHNLEGSPEGDGSAFLAASPSLERSASPQQRECKSDRVAKASAGTVLARKSPVDSENVKPKTGPKSSSKPSSRDAVFKPKEGPSPGKYDIPPFGKDGVGKKGRSSCFSSTTPRLVEIGQEKLTQGSFGAYDCSKSYSIAFSKGGKLVSTSKRFADDVKLTPGPGSYDSRTPQIRSTKVGPSSVFASKTKAHQLPSAVSLTPSPGAYNVDSFVQSEEQKKRGLAVFASKTPRVPDVPRSDAPPPGSYEPKISSSSLAVSIHSSAARFREPKQVSPGPCAYEWKDIKQKQTFGRSSSFSSKSEAHPIQINGADTPSPLDYNVDFMARQVEKKRPSSAFQSKSPRLVEIKSDVPPVGAYNVESHGSNKAVKSAER